MKPTTALVILATALSTNAIPHHPRQAFNPGSLLPKFGVTNNTDPGFDGQVGTCRGIKQDGSPIGIPCGCPPDRDIFDRKLMPVVREGKVTTIDTAGTTIDTYISFSMDPNDTSPETIKARGTAALILLQSSSGHFGLGCPAVSAPNFVKMQERGVVRDAVLVP